MRRKRHMSSGNRLDKIVNYIFLPYGVYRRIRDETLKWSEKGRESCGVLAGYRICREKQCYIVVKDTIIGPATDRSGAHCYVDADYAEEVLTRLRREDKDLDYVGEWHSHYFQENPQPSGGDVSSLRSVNAFENGRFHPSVVVITGIKKGRVVLNAFSYSDEIGVYRVPIVIIGRAYKFDILDLDVYNRIQEVVDLAAMGKKAVAVVGLGSGGSHIAVLLAKAGVGKLVLIDDDVYAPSNLIRAMPLLFDVGYPKTTAVKKTIKRYSLKTKVKTYRLRISWENIEKLREALKDVDLVVDATGSEKVRLILNKLAFELGKPVIMAWASDRAVKNVIFAMLSPLPEYADYACYECLFKHNIFEEEAYDSGIEEEARKYGYDWRQLDHIVAAQGLLVDLFPSIGYVAKLALEILSGNFKPGAPNLYLISQDTLEVHKWRIPRHDECEMHRSQKS